MDNLRIEQIESHQKAVVDLRGRSNIIIETPLFDKMSQEERIERINELNNLMRDLEQKNTEYEFMYARISKKYFKKAFDLFKNHISELLYRPECSIKH